NAVRFPPVDQARISEPGYRATIEQSMKEAAALRDALILELFHADPNDNNLPPLMEERWRRRPPGGPQDAKLRPEIAGVLARTQKGVLRTGRYLARAQAGLFKSRQTGTLDLSGVEEFVQKAPKDQRGPLLLYMGMFVARDEKAKQALETRLL